jgi:hypothetical protein
MCTRTSYSTGYDCTDQPAAAQPAPPSAGGSAGDNPQPQPAGSQDNGNGKLVLQQLNRLHEAFKRSQISPASSSSQDQPTLPRPIPSQRRLTQQLTKEWNGPSTRPSASPTQTRVLRNSASSLVCGGQPSPHKPRLIVSHSTCPPLSSSPHAHSFVLGTAVINNNAPPASEAQGQGPGLYSPHRNEWAGGASQQCPGSRPLSDWKPLSSWLGTMLTQVQPRHMIGW